jgi:NAD(P)-dependent dehydrogenase (short-subunit alcohol dehydrogenase family)
MDIPVVLITGALTGIGRVTAIAFAQEGARLIVSGSTRGSRAKISRGVPSP